MTSLNVGDMAPDFLLPGDDGDSLSIRDFNKKNVVLYFYPKDDTPGCTREAKDFRDNIDEFVKLNTLVIGVSRDSIDRHEDFKKKYDLPFVLVADEDLIAAKEYGVWVEKNLYGRKYMGTQRSTFLIGKENIIKKIWRKVKVAGHVAQVLEAVRELEIENQNLLDQKLQSL